MNATTVTVKSLFHAAVYFRVVFSVYIFFTALVLVNLLIAMMTNRYKQARKSAECTWRFNGVAFGLRIQRLLAAALGRCRIRAFLPQCDQDPDLPGRYLLKVREKPDRTGPVQQQQQLRANITKLRAEMKEINDRINAFQHEHHL